MTPERFKAIMNEVKAKTGVKGKDLFHPVRIALTGSHSGPEFDKLIPILEEGSRSEEHTSELQSLRHLVCRLLLVKKHTCNSTRFRQPRRHSERRTPLLSPRF